MLYQWMTADDGVYCAERLLCVDGGINMLRMQVTSLGESGWDWQVWDQAGHRRQQYGLADTLEEAKTKAEGKLEVLVQELSRLE